MQPEEIFTLSFLDSYWLFMCINDKNNFKITFHKSAINLQNMTKCKLIK